MCGAIRHQGQDELWAHSHFLRAEHDQNVELIKHLNSRNDLIELTVYWALIKQPPKEIKRSYRKLEEIHPDLTL